MVEIMSSMRFMALWSLGSLLAIIAYLAVMGVTALLFGIISSVLILLGLAPMVFPVALAGVCFIGLMTGLITGMIQQRIFHARYNIWLKHWRLASALGGLVGMMLMALLNTMTARQLVESLSLPNAQILMILGSLMIVVPLLCIGIAQSFVLARRVYHVWLWVLANFVAGMVAFVMVPAFAVQPNGTILISNIFMLLPIALAPGIVTGFVMLWLMRYQRRYEL